jgi:2-polyprenyl-3-methyl-5-hydroxy-6-metoxy-1,4-benzoquinol methylase
MAGDYHYQDFADRSSPYHHHVTDLVHEIERFVAPFSGILDVGCGEGLIMSQLEAVNYHCFGLDIDQIAVQIGQKKGNQIRHGTIDSELDDAYEAVLLCDVLEHVADFDATIEKAQKVARSFVVVAVPDRHDAHAVRQNVVSAVIDKFKGWELLKSSCRHARWLMIFKKVPR